MPDYSSPDIKGLVPGSKVIAIVDIDSMAGRLVIQKGYTGKFIGYISAAHPTHLVEWDKFINGHDGNRNAPFKGKDGHCWWVRPESIAPLHSNHISRRERC